MKGDVKILSKLVDSYIADIKSAITTLNVEAMDIGSMPIHRKVRLEELKNMLTYVQHQRDKALFIDADFVDTEKSLKNINKDDSHFKDL